MTSQASSQVEATAGKKPQRKLRSACDFCHQTKVRCSRGNPCQACAALDSECVYSVSNRIGRPRGTKNKRTLERLERERVLAEASKAEAEKNEAFMAYHSQMMGMPVSRSSSIALGPHGIGHPLQAFTPGQPLPLEIPAALPQDFQHLSTPTQPLSAPPVFNVDAQWPQLAGNEQVQWMTREIAGNGPHVAHQVMPTHLDLLGGSGGVEMMASTAWQETMSPQDYYLTPHSSRRNTDSRPSPEYQQPLFQSSNAPRQVSPPDSISDDTSVSRRPGLPYRSFTSAHGIIPGLCNCFQIQTGVVCRLRRLSTEPNARIDVLVEYARQSIASWKALMECEHCLRSDDQETLMLCTSAIRLFLSCIQNLTPQIIHTPPPDSGFGQFPMVGRIRGASIDSSFSEIAMSRVGSTQSVATELDMESYASQTFVSKIYLYRAVGQVRELLASLRLFLESKQASNLSAGQHSNSLQQPWQMIDISPFASQPVGMEANSGVNITRASLENNSQDEGEDSVHILSRVRRLESTVYDLCQRLKDWQHG